MCHTFNSHDFELIFSIVSAIPSMIEACDLISFFAAKPAAIVLAQNSKVHVRDKK